MIAKHVLYISEGLYWKWKVYRKMSKVATLHKPSWPGNDLEILNALTRTCRTACNELKGLIFTLNIFHFSKDDICPAVVPSRWHEAPEGRIAAVERALEGFDMFQGFVRQRFVSVVLHIDIWSCDEITPYLKRLEQLSSDRSRIALTVVVDYWSLVLPDDYSITAKIQRLEAETDLSDEEFRNTVTRASIKEEMMLSRIKSFLDFGARLQAMLREAGALRANRSWSLLPDLTNSKASDVASYKALLSPDEQDLLESFYPGGL